MNAKQARLTANGFSHRRKELEKLLPKLEKSWSELPEENPKMGKARISLPGWIWSVCQKEIAGKGQGILL
jgi:hypothetical protein